MDQSYLISQMTWSYSRLTAFEDCPYRFLLRYITDTDAPEEKKFFSSYGSLMHDLYAGYYSGKLSAEDLPIWFSARYFSEVPSDSAPKFETYMNYYRTGLDRLTDFKPIPGKVLAVEKRAKCKVAGYSFIGYPDLITETDRKFTYGGKAVWDHKSHILKQPGASKKSDQELSEYLRQLYIYAAFIKNEYGEWPAWLCFNSFRSGELIRVPFSLKRFHEVMDWIKQLIDQIMRETQWRPKPEFFKCKYICSMSGRCEYYQMNK